MSGLTLWRLSWKMAQNGAHRLSSLLETPFPSIYLKTSFTTWSDWISKRLCQNVLFFTSTMLVKMSKETYGRKSTPAFTSSTCENGISKHKRLKISLQYQSIWGLENTSKSLWFKHWPDTQMSCTLPGASVSQGCSPGKSLDPPLWCQLTPNWAWQMVRITGILVRHSGRLDLITNPALYVSAALNWVFSF